MKIFLIAGEASGDTIGAVLIEALKEQIPGDVQFSGIGGPLMKDAGLDVLLPMDQLNVMGFFELIPALPRLYKIYQATLAEIEKQDPDIVVTIDLPDFNFFIGSGLKKRGKSKAKIIHYVAPTVWAWRPKRAHKIAAFLDGLICLLPFEPEYFEKHGLKTKFVGHPIAQEVQDGDGDAFKKSKGIPGDAKVVGLLFGSRESEIKRHGAIMKETMLHLREKHDNIYVVVPTLPHMEYHVLNLLEDFDFPSYVVKEKEYKWDAFASLDVALAVSGTVALELAYKGVPHVILYRMNPLNWQIAKFVIKVRHAHLANIMMKETVVPEFLQHQCKPDKIAEDILKLMDDPEAIAAEQAAFEKLREMLNTGDDESSSAKAARFVLEITKG